MSKYSNEFKLKVVKYCIDGHHGFKSTADHFNIPAKVTVQKWCRKYEEHGEKGLLRLLIILEIFLFIFSSNSSFEFVLLPHSF